MSRIDEKNAKKCVVAYNTYYNELKKKKTNVYNLRIGLYVVIQGY